MSIHCWNCGHTLEDLISPLPFREECPHCSAELHCCKNCRYYSIGKPNDCSVPGTEFVSNREVKNFCEEFKLLGNSPKKEPSKEEIAKRLFGD